MKYVLYLLSLGFIVWTFFESSASEALLPETAKSSCAFEKLALKKPCGQDFWLMLKDMREDRTGGLAEEPFLKHAGYYRSNPVPGLRSNPHGGNVPVIIACSYERPSIERLKSQEWIKEYGEAFIGAIHLEGKWNVVKPWKFNDDCLKATEMAFPKTKEESYRIIEAYFKRTLLLDNINVPVLPGSIGFLDHHTLRWGAVATTTYVGSNLLYAQLQSAFARGAARQFGKLWSVYYATWGLCMPVDLPNDGIHATIDNSIRFNYRSPEITELSHGRYNYYGAKLGADVKTTMRPNYYYCYMAGANFLENESDSFAFRYAGYDPHGAPEPPLLMNIREGRIYPSPVVDLYREIYAYSQRQPRGIPYTPFAILLDRHHGYILPNNSKYFTFAPFDAGDYQINAVFDAMFPFERSSRNIRLARLAKSLKDVPAEQNCFINLPYGNIFDVLTNDCSSEILSAYPVVMLTGLQGDWPDLGDKLADYVKGGGTLIMDVSQLRKEMSAEMVGAEKSDEILKGSAYVDLNGNRCDEQEYTYQKMKLTNGEALYMDASSGLPLLIRTKYGKGVVLLSTVPYFLDNRKKENAKVLKFYERMLSNMAEEVMPVRARIVSGSIDYSLNKLGEDWLVTLINYDGITHNMCQAAVLDKSKTAKINLEADGIFNAVETISGEKISCIHKDGRSNLDLAIEPGEIKIIKLSR